MGKGILRGFARLNKYSAVPLRALQRNMALLVNSVPLSRTKVLGSC